MNNKYILDACCGSRMFWFDKSHKDTLFMDSRTMKPTLMSNRSVIEVKPDMIGDFRKMVFADESFSLVVFDPPHMLRAGDKSFLAKKYGYLSPKTWKEDIKAGFKECFRVLRPHGTLIFKWNEAHIPVKEIIKLAPAQPLFGNRAQGKNLKTHWIVFTKAA